MEDVRNRLIELRESHGLNRKEMAQKLGTTKSTITRYETGEMRPNLDAIINIKNVFGVSLDWIAGFDTDKMAEYDPIVEECIQAEIAPDNLMDAVDFVKKQRNR